MIEENGQVVKVEDDGMVWVETRRQSTCGACADRQGCGTSVLASVLGQRQAPVRVINSIGAVAGDQVVIGVPESGLLRGSLAVYAVPLAGLFCRSLGPDGCGGRLHGRTRLVETVQPCYQPG
jgi:sigma-E factor negative regulatory protein RseC